MILAMPTLPSVRRILLLIVAWLLLPAGVHAQDTAAEIRGLLKQRINVLEEAVKVAVGGWQFGAVDCQTVCETQKELHKARQTACENANERMAALRKSLETAEDMVKKTKQRERIDKQGTLNSLLAQAWMLEIRIELLKEHQKAKQ